jgi:hypothetical protein
MWIFAPPVSIAERKFITLTLYNAIANGFALFLRLDLL